MNWIHKVPLLNETIVFLFGKHFKQWLIECVQYWPVSNELNSQWTNHKLSHQILILTLLQYCSLLLSFGAWSCTTSFYCDQPWYVSIFFSTLLYCRLRSSSFNCFNKIRGFFPIANGSTCHIVPMDHQPLYSHRSPPSIRPIRTTIVYHTRDLIHHFGLLFPYSPNSLIKCVSPMAYQTYSYYFHLIFLLW